MMSKVERPTNRGINAIIMVNGVVIGGQKNCILNRTMTPINITNKIHGEWQTSLSGLKSWSVNCTGIFIKDAESFDILENAFYNGEEIEIILTDNNRKYQGTALITSFPINANYNDTFTYSISCLGTSPLEE